MHEDADTYQEITQVDYHDYNCGYVVLMVVS